MSWMSEFGPAYAPPEFLTRKPWKDTSWCCDTGSSFANEEKALIVYVDHEDASKREFFEDHRYSVYALGEGPEENDPMMVLDWAPLLQTSSEEVLEAFLSSK